MPSLEAALLAELDTPLVMLVTALELVLK